MDSVSLLPGSLASLPGATVHACSKLIRIIQLSFMKAPLPLLPVWTLVELERTRSDIASVVGGKLLESLLPDSAENVGEMVKATLVGVSGVSGVTGPFRPALSSAARAVSRALASPVERLSRPRRVNLSVGNIVCIREAARFDLVELLQRVMSELRLSNLRLVRPGITFEEARRYYSWPGMLIEFYDAPPGSGLHPH